jgi:hypothetical protein
MSWFDCRAAAARTLAFILIGEQRQKTHCSARAAALSRVRSLSRHTRVNIRGQMVLCWRETIKRRHKHFNPQNPFVFISSPLTFNGMTAKVNMSGGDSLLTNFIN